MQVILPACSIRFGDFFLRFNRTLVLGYSAACRNLSFSPHLHWLTRALEENLQKTVRNFIQAPVVRLKTLDNLFIELSRKSCNLRCKHCYIEKSPYKQENDFIELEKIKNALRSIVGKNVQSIYLTGGEPLMHSDFNQILRMCLSITNVTILTNGMMINEKKARFLKKIDDESSFETVYRISFEHYDENKNDAIRGRGSFRKALFAIMALAKYDFNPIISTTNFYKEDKKSIQSGFENMFQKAGIEFEAINLKIMPYFEKCTGIQDGKNLTNLDCVNSRILTKKGVFSCPALSGDFRARMGNDMTNFSDKMVLDTEFCQTCMAHEYKAFANDWL